MYYDGRERNDLLLALSFEQGTRLREGERGQGKGNGDKGRGTGTREGELGKRLREGKQGTKAKGRGTRNEAKRGRAENYKLTSTCGRVSRYSGGRWLT